MQDQKPIILWFRAAFRLRDHPALQAALRKARETQASVIALYVHDPYNGQRRMGAASQWWLNRSLKALQQELENIGCRLIFRTGPQRDVLETLITETGADAIYTDHIFEPGAVSEMKTLSEAYITQGVSFHGFNTTHLTRPLRILAPSSQAPYQVFTPYFNALLSSGAFVGGHLSDAPLSWPNYPTAIQSVALESLGLKISQSPSGHDWSTEFTGQPGEAGAIDRFSEFLAQDFTAYAQNRDRPDLDLTSHLAAHIRFGEISLHRMIYEIQNLGSQCENQNRFFAQLAWREFSYQQLFQQPELHRINLKPGFDRMPWVNDPTQFQAWCQGRTGYEMVDAGMRQLWQTGFMHNRVRMLAASFLCKHLLIDWRWGEAWFWDTLTDADPANNPAGWQWVAGCGMDAAPYFRIFNPLTQADKFDPDGTYRRIYLNNKMRYSTHPVEFKGPVIEHSYARDRALKAYQFTKGVL